MKKKKCEWLNETERKELSRNIPNRRNGGRLLDIECSFIPKIYSRAHCNFPGLHFSFALHMRMSSRQQRIDDLSRRLAALWQRSPQLAMAFVSSDPHPRVMHSGREDQRKEWRNHPPLGHVLFISWISETKLHQCSGLDVIRFSGRVQNLSNWRNLRL